MSYKAHSKYPKFISASNLEEDPFIYYFPRGNKYYDLDGEVPEEATEDEGFSVMDNDSFKIVVYNSVCYAVNYDTGICLKIDPKTGKVIKPELGSEFLWVEPDTVSGNYEYITGKNDDVLQILLQSELMNLTFEIPTDPVIVSTVPLQSPSPSPSPGQIPEEMDEDFDFLGIPADDAEFQIGEIGEYAENIAVENLGRESKEEQRVYNEQLRMLIEDIQPFSNDEQLTRYFTSLSSLIDRAEYRSNRTDAYVPEWLVPVVSDKLNSKYTGSEMSGVMMLEDIRKLYQKLGTADYDKSLKDLTTGFLQKTPKDSTSYVDYKIPNSNRFELPLIVDPVICSPNPGASINLADSTYEIYRSDATQYNIRLKLEETVAENIALRKRGAETSALIAVAQRGTGVKDISCDTSIPANAFVTGFLKLPIFSTKKRRMKPVNSSLNDEKPNTYPDDQIYYKIAEGTDFPTALQQAKPTLNELVAFSRGLEFKNLGHASNMFRVYGVDPKEVPVEIYRKLRFVEAPEPDEFLEKQAHLKKYFTEIDDTELPVYEWMIKHRKELSELLGEIKLQPDHMGILKDVIKTYEFGNLLKAYDEMRKSVKKSARKRDAIATVIWRALSIKQRKQVYIARGQQINKVDGNKFKSIVLSSYKKEGLTYPYFDRLQDTDETRIAWLRSTPDNGSLYLLNLQSGLSRNKELADSIKSDLLKHQSALGKIDTDSAPVTVSVDKKKLVPDKLVIKDGRLLVWHQKSGDYISRDDYIRIQQIKRYRAIISELEKYAELSSDLEDKLQIARLRLKANIVNNTVIRAIDTVPPLKKAIGSAYFQYIKKLDLRGEQAHVVEFLRILRSSAVQLNGEHMYVLADTQENICCEHFKYWLESDENLDGLIEHYGVDTSEGSTCKYCGSLLKEAFDEFAGFIEGRLNVQSSVLEYDTSSADKLADKPYNVDSELETQTYVVSTMFAAQLGSFKLEVTTVKEIIRRVKAKFTEVMQEDTANYYRYVLNAENALEIVKKLGPDFERLFPKKGSVSLYKKKKDVDDHKVEIYQIVNLHWFIIKLPEIIANCLIDLELEYNLKVAAGSDLIKQATNVVTTELPVWYSKTVSNLIIGNPDNDYSSLKISNFDDLLMKTVKYTIKSGFDLESYLIANTREIYENLISVTYRAKYEVLREFQRKEELVDYSLISESKLASNLIGFQKAPLGLGLGLGLFSDSESLDAVKLTRYNNLASAEAVISENTTDYKVLAEKIAGLTISRFSSNPEKTVVQTLSQYDVFSRANILDETEECYVSPSQCVFGMTLTGKDCLVQEWYVGPKSLDAEPEVVRTAVNTYNEQNNELLEMIDLDYQTLKETGLQETKEQLMRTFIPTNMINGSNRLYQIQSKTTVIKPPSTGTLQVPLVTSTTRPKISEWTRQMVIKLLFDPSLGSSTLDIKLDELVKVDLKETGEMYPFSDALDQLRISNLRRDELATSNMKSFEMFERVIKNQKDSTFTGFSDRINSVSRLLSLPSVTTEKTPTPFADRMNVFISKNCVFNNDTKRVLGFYNLVSLAGSIVTNYATLTPSLSPETEGDRLVRILKDFMSKFPEESENVEFVSTYRQFMRPVMELSMEEVHKILSEETSDELELEKTELLRNMNTTMNKLFSRALKLEIYTHLYRLCIVPKEIVDIELVPESDDTLRAKPVANIMSVEKLTVDRGTVNFMNLNRFILFIRLLTIYMYKNTEITDPLNSNYYNQLADSEFAAMKKYVTTKSDSTLRSVGLTEADIDEALEAKKESEEETDVAADEAPAEAEEEEEDADEFLETD